MPKVSVIVAIYNAEKFIERCCHSLFSQTLDDIEYLFVDDCSPDNSISVVNKVLIEYPLRISQVKIIKHKENQGVASTRTDGMKAASGEFYIHCDPDDWIEPDMYESMYYTARKLDADIVTCDYYEENGDKTILRHNSYYSISPQDCIKHIHEKNFFPSLCTTMTKRELIIENELYPFAGINSGEDLNLLLRCFYFANKTIHIERPFYHYLRHMGSLSLKKDYSKHFEESIFPNVNKICDFFFSKTDCDDYAVSLNYLKFQKKMFLLQGKTPNLKKWWNTWPESNKNIDLYSSLPLRTRKIFKLCSSSFLVLWFYFNVIRKIIR